MWKRKKPVLRNDPLVLPGQSVRQLKKPFLRKDTPVRNCVVAIIIIGTATTLYWLARSNRHCGGSLLFCNFD